MNKLFRRVAFKHLLIPLLNTLILFTGFSYLVRVIQVTYVDMFERGLLWLYILLLLLIIIGFFCSGFLLISLIFFILRGFPITTKKYKQMLARDVSTYLSVELFCVSFFPKRINKISEEFYNKISKEDWS
jgi:hypothetical protein